MTLRADRRGVPRLRVPEPEAVRPEREAAAEAPGGPEEVRAVARGEHLLGFAVRTHKWKVNDVGESECFPFPFPLNDVGESERVF